MKYGKQFVLAVMLTFALAVFAQKPMDQASEKAVKITNGPTVQNNNGSTATLHWTTDRQGANLVHYRRAGSNEQWKTAYHSGGGTDHNVQLTGLQPGQTYEYQILTQDGDLRTSGQFQAGGSANAATAASTPTSTPAASGADPMATANASDKVTIYRELGPNGQHSFTTSATSTMPGFHVEGIAGYALNSQRPGLTALYRLTNQAGDTLFTTDPNERQSAISQGYTDQGVLGYIATTQWGGTSPLYRMIASNGQHFYTVSPQEHQSALGQGMRDEATIGYLWTQQ